MAEVQSRRHEFEAAGSNVIIISFGKKVIFVFVNMNFKGIFFQLDVKSHFILISSDF